ncbi:hypothetical protein RND81_12G040400 [Saponaria officinalis]|uniref:CCHC-type domain-containing protein n=1 Tax=Saponaria officinalis TaxID=3572 RepID=A0AAW1H5H8_SAPOF
MWKKDVLMALTAKNKDVFLEGRCHMPERSDKKHHQWLRCDLMIMKWILKPLHKSIRENLMYVHTSKQLWSELNERYALTSCTCQFLKRLVDKETRTKLIQFLMGLNSAYESVKTTVLTMDPPSSINKTLSLLQKIERQKQLSDSVDALGDAAVPWKRPKFDREDKVYRECSHCHKKGYTRDECYKLQTCSYCHVPGHVKEQCYKLKNVTAEECSYCHVPGHVKEQCYKLKNVTSERGRGRGFNRGGPYAHKRDLSPLEDVCPSAPVKHYDSVTEHSQSVENTDMVNDIVNTVMTKVMKAFSKQTAASNASHADTNFAVHNAVTTSDWIIDTGASDHMTSNIDLLHNIRVLCKPLIVVLPDGSQKVVHQIGNMQLLLDIFLETVLVVLGFQQNLLSVGRLLQGTNLCIFFLADKCCIQDFSSKTVLLTVQKQGDLFRVKQRLENCSSGSGNKITVSLVNTRCTHISNVSLLHNRLGHTSCEKLAHVLIFT